MLKGIKDCFLRLLYGIGTIIRYLDTFVFSSFHQSLMSI